MRASSSARTLALSRQQSQRTTRRTPSVVTDFQPVSSQSAQAIVEDRIVAPRRATATRARTNSVIFVPGCPAVARLSVLFSWMFDGDCWRRPDEIGRRRFHEGG